MSAKTTKMEAAKLISEYRENELKKKDPDLKRLQLLANTDRGPVGTNTRRLIVIVLILAAIACILWFKSWSPSNDGDKRNAASSDKTYESMGPFHNASYSPVNVSTTVPLFRTITDTPGSTAGTKTGLRVTQSGSLVVDGRTRKVIEELSAVSDLQELHEELQALHHTLPPIAAEQACDLVERYYHFQKAFANRMTPNDVVASPGEALSALDHLHALRIEFFGTELAQLWFAEEEAFGRSLINNQWQNAN